MPLPIAWLIKKVGPLVATLILIGAALLLLWIVYSGIRHFFTAGLEKQAEVSTGQTGAVINSAKDAINEVGNTQTKADAHDQISSENDDAIDNSSAHNVTVPVDARAVGVQSLCRRESYRRKHAECLQQPATR